MDCCWNLPVVGLPNRQVAAPASTCLGGLLRSACVLHSERAYHVASAGQPRRDGFLRTGTARMTPNYAMERTGNGRRMRAAGAPDIVAPAARGNCWRAAAHRGR
jgi:hypothetical protein